jgi:surface carbohydrate biosynthesis protein
MRVYLPIEVKKRELTSRILFSIFATLNNMETVIGGKNAILSRIKYAKKGIFMFKSIQHGEYDLMKDLKKNHFSLCSTDEEGLMYFDDINYYRRFEEKNFLLLDFFFTWGLKDKISLSKKFIKHKDIIIPVGNPRIDILNEKINSIYSEQAKKLKEKHGNFILLTTKFARYNKIPRGWSTYFIGQKNNGYIKNLHDKKIAILSEFHEKKNIKLFVDFIKNFPRNFPDLKLIIRPHPAEDRKFWSDVIEKNNNVILCFDEVDTNAYILACDFLIQSNCTTSLEAYQLNKFSINYLPFSKKEVEYDIPKIVSKNIYNEKELVNFINNYREKKKSLERRELNDLEKEKLNYAIFNLYNLESSNSIIKNLKRINLNNEGYDKRTGLVYYYFFYFKFLLIIFYNRFIKKNFITLQMAKLSKQKFPGLNLKEVIYLKNNICEKLNVNSNQIKIEEKYPGFFLIKKV